MNFDLTDDQQDIKRTAREFLGARYKLEEVRRLALEEERGFTDAQWDEIVQLGWPELAVRESGFGVVELAVVAEELGYACAPTPLSSSWAAALLLDAAGEAGRLSDGRRGTVAQWDEDTDGRPDQSQTVTIWATDTDGATASTTFSLVVNNLPPTVSPNHKLVSG